MYVLFRSYQIEKKLWSVIGMDYCSTFLDFEKSILYMSTSRNRILGISSIQMGLFIFRYSVELGIGAPCPEQMTRFTWSTRANSIRIHSSNVSEESSERLT